MMDNNNKQQQRIVWSFLKWKVNYCLARKSIFTSLFLFSQHKALSFCLFDWC